MQIKAIKKEYNSETKVGTKTFYKRLYDPETGEAEYVPVSKQEIRYGQKHFIRVNTAALFMLSAGLGKNSYLLLTYFMNNVNRENICHRTGSYIAKEISMNASTFDKATAELREHKLVVSAGHGEWMLNPTVGVSCEEEYREILQDTFDSFLKPKLRKRSEGAEDAGGQSI